MLEETQFCFKSYGFATAVCSRIPMGLGVEEQE
jgi:hypothetical protein